MKMVQMSEQEIENVFGDLDDVEKLRNSSILITGATGLIGQTLVKVLLYANKYYNLNIYVYAFVRDIKKAELLFGEFENCQNLKYIEGDIINTEIYLNEPIDYIIHGASITENNMFVEKPVETINTGIIGTENILEFARYKQVKSVVYLSSMEVYGGIWEKTPVKESDLGYINPLLTRSSYSESKRMIENICISYHEEYGVPVKIIRLAQTFGPGVRYNDNRIFAEIAKCVIKSKDIVLYTEGTSERMYLYTLDAAGAIITVLIKGLDGEAYNAANEETYCSIRQMAEMVTREIAENKIKVLIDVDRTKARVYPPVHRLYLDIGKLKGLGWSAKTGLLPAYRKMIEAMEYKE